jgi:hypothetical protein
MAKNTEVQTGGEDLVKLVSPKKQPKGPMTLRKQAKSKAMWNEVTRVSGDSDSEGMDFLGVDPY